ncbi:hypothetical protein H632_c3860p0, partial [Helicosporidium sp. ATCC 50920]
EPRLEVLDAEARIFLFHNFLSRAETDHIISLAEPHLARSGVVGTSGHHGVSEVRTSKGMFLSRRQDQKISDLEERIARWTLLPVGNGEGLQVLRYSKTQKYDAHWDYFFHKEGTSNGGNRYATVLMYLADTEEGGETVFPNIPAPGGDNGPGYSECARKFLAAKPRRGDAVLFHSIRPNGELERRSLHTACPVIKGVKWSAAKWIHVGHFAMDGEKPMGLDLHPQPVHVPGCEDADDRCPGWAERGECETNGTFMIGTPENPGHCIASCQRCAQFFSDN